MKSKSGSDNSPIRELVLNVCRGAEVARPIVVHRTPGAIAVHPARLAIDEPALRPTAQVEQAPSGRVDVARRELRWTQTGLAEWGAVVPGLKLGEVDERVVVGGTRVSRRRLWPPDAGLVSVGTRATAGMRAGSGTAIGAGSGVRIDARIGGRSGSKVSAGGGASGGGSGDSIDASIGVSNITSIRASVGAIVGVVGRAALDTAFGCRGWRAFRSPLRLPLQNGTFVCRLPDVIGKS